MRCCILKLGGLGDLLMMTPGLRAFRKSFPEAYIGFIVGESNSQVFKNCAYVDDVFTVDDRKIFQGRHLERWKEIFRLRALIRRLHVGRIFLAHRDWRWNLLAYTCGVPHRSGFSRDLRGMFLTDAISTSLSEHEIEKYQKLFGTQVGYECDGDRMELFPSQEDYKAIDSLVQKSEGVPMVAIAPGGASNAKETRSISRWPVECYHTLVSRLLEETECLIYLVGGPSDSDVIREVMGGRRDSRVVDTSGRTTVQQSFLLLQHCDVFVTHDCGPMHIGAAAGIPVISLFGPTYPVEKRPISSPDSVAIWHGSGISCSPCYQDGIFPQCSDQICMRMITVDAVIEAVRHVLDGGSTGGPRHEARLEHR